MWEIILRPLRSLTSCNLEFKVNIMTCLCMYSVHIQIQEPILLSIYNKKATERRREERERGHRREKMERRETRKKEWAGRGGLGR